ncbi:hypothetical protein ACH5RR_026943 [Cinchona calisaya]|uniref:BHLH domain-containing protein n=1 Tax=Cinchona calisaya TaxID=153742 RepID=A0ABD2Z5W8_9GENT
MALDAAIHSQDSFGYFCKEFYTLGGANGKWDYNYGFDLQEEKGFLDHKLVHENWESSSSSVVMQNVKDLDPNSSPETCTADQVFVEGCSTSTITEEPRAAASAPAAGKRKRSRRTKSCKNKQELENQRMTHIAVERNRRKQMNDYLAVIRSLMPPSYVQRVDQASIIGGAINFVKELEQHLQTLEAQKRTINQQQRQPPENGILSQQLFADFFTFPQYSISNLQKSNINSPSTNTTTSDHQPNGAAEIGKRSALADIEVTMAESHANLKILSKKRPRQLLKLVARLQCLWLTILHLNVTTTLDQRVLYSISVKLEEGCQLTTVDEIADAVNQLLGRIDEEAV